MPINVNDPEYVRAEKEYHDAKSPKERLDALHRMISHAPKHKGGENLRQQLTTRRKKLESEIEKKRKSGKSTQTGIKKEDLQAIIIGKTNSGKSSLLNLITNSEPDIADYEFTTKEPIIGMLKHEGVNIQIIENPSIDSDYYDKGIANNTDVLILVVNNLQEISEIEKNLEKAKGKRILVFNKIDKLSSEELRKLTATLKSKYKKYKFVLTSVKNEEGVEELKDAIFGSFDKIRIYTKEPGKEKSNRPMILEIDSTIQDVAEKILKGFSKKIKEVRIWGPSSKFPAQKVGLQHKLKDQDVVEFKTR